jgi:hypothetical protein
MELQGLGDIVSERRDWNIIDKEMCTYCLLHRSSETCFGKGTDRKPPAWGLNAGGAYQVGWLHSVLKEKSVSINVIKSEEADGDGSVNLAMGCNNGG